MNQPSDSAKEVVTILRKELKQGKTNFSRNDVSSLLTVVEHFEEIVDEHSNQTTTV